jgi:hypothetical protein
LAKDVANDLRLPRLVSLSIGAFAHYISCVVTA